MTESPYSLERIADRMEIQDVMLRWCRAVDRLDLDSVTDLFHPDATDDHAVYKGDVVGLVAWIRDRHQAIEFSAHVIANCLIEFAGPDRAVVETYVYTLQRYKPNAGSRLTSLIQSPENEGAASRTDSFAHARYVDTFERREDRRWRVARRVSVVDWLRTDDVPDGAFELNTTWSIGRRDRTDPLYAARAAAGLTG